jgi:hypothetical protein
MKPFMVLSAVLLLSTCVAGEQHRDDVPIMAGVVDTRSGDLQRCEWKGYDVPPDCAHWKSPQPY